MKFVFFFLLLSGLSAFAQRPIDMQHYTFDLNLSDRWDSIQGRAVVSFKAVQPLRSFDLDLVPVENGKGMKVHRVTLENGKVKKPLPFSHKGEKLNIILPDTLKAGEGAAVSIVYGGVPRDGLIISKNRFGDRTFFADNWPNRAHHWIPCVDEPIDKASFEFIVRAPKEYTVISNGTRTLLKEEKSSWTRTNDGKLTWVYAEQIPLSTKIMVIGVARFAVKQYDDSPKSVPVSAYIFQQDSTRGFFDYAAAPSILQFFSKYIGPFPFAKLANVQSKTIFGGMENAGAIFYAETSVNGKAEVEDLLAHEIAHQWFGDMASEKSFTHLWLSEGFATYLTHIYLESKYGGDVLMKRMDEDRQTIIRFAASSNAAVVDENTAYMELLNANSYQKGGWVLHMLRQQVGDKVFQKIIQQYYESFKGGNADTKDFQEVAQRVAEKDLATFFDQWLYRGEMPFLSVESSVSDGKLQLLIRQESELPFEFPLEIAVVDEDGASTIHTVSIQEKETRASFPVKGSKATYKLDPNVKLLFREKK